MGCDIHAHAERKVGTTWVPFKYPWTSPMDGSVKEYDYSNFFWQRSYFMFALLGYEGRHWLTEDISKLTVPNRNSIPEDASEAIRASYEEWGYEGHSPNWATLRDLQISFQAIWDQREALREEDDEESPERILLVFKQVIIEPLEELGMDPDKIRMIYWFDN